MSSVSKEGRSAARRARAPRRRRARNPPALSLALRSRPDPSLVSVTAARPSSRWSPRLLGRLVVPKPPSSWFPARPCPRTRGSSARRARERRASSPARCTADTCRRFSSSCARATERCRRARRRARTPERPPGAGPRSHRAPGTPRTPRHRRGEAACANPARTKRTKRAHEARRRHFRTAPSLGSGATPHKAPGTPRARTRVCPRDPPACLTRAYRTRSERTRRRLESSSEHRLARQSPPPVPRPRRRRGLHLPSAHPRAPRLRPAPRPYPRALPARARHRPRRRRPRRPPCLEVYRSPHRARLARASV